MDKEKLKSYKLIGSIHTFQLKTKDVLNKEVIGELLGTKVIQTYHVGVDGITSSITFDLNLIEGDILTFKEFCEKFNDVMSKLGIVSYQLLRVDFRCDSFENGFHEQFKKIHYVLASCMKVAYDLKNTYESKQLLTLKDLNACAKGKLFEFENYNRKEKSIVTGNLVDRTVSRVELRSKASVWSDRRKQYPKKTEMQNIKDEFTKAWKKRLKASIKSLDDVCTIANNTLLQRYDEGKNPLKRKFRTLTDFLLQYENILFTYKQLQGFLKDVGEKNPVKKSYNLAGRYYIELYEKQNINAILKEINRCINDYFAESQK